MLEFARYRAGLLFRILAVWMILKMAMTDYKHIRVFIVIFTWVTGTRPQEDLNGTFYLFRGTGQLWTKKWKINSTSSKAR